MHTQFLVRFGRIFFLIGLLTLATSGSLWAQTIHVRMDGSDTVCNGTVDVSAAGFVGTDQPCAVQTIDQGVSLAAVGGEIRVAAGIYTERVVINKTVQLRGARSGVDGRTRDGSHAGETVVNHPSNSFFISADDVVLDGFIIEGATTPPYNYGLFLNKNFSGYQIINNIIQGNVMGLYPNANGVTQTLIQFNQFKNNGQPGPAPHAIYTDQGSKNILVDSNLFVDNASCAMNFVSFNGALAEDITITNNQIDSTTTGVCLAAALNVLVENNIMTTSWRSVDLNGGNNGIVIQNNILSGNGASAIRSRNLDNPPPFGLNTNIQILENQITNNSAALELQPNSLAAPLNINFNRIFNNSLIGIFNDSGVVINAEHNWWGCNAGPNDAAGDCDTFDLNVDADPWLVLGLSSTPSILTTTEAADLLADLTFNSEGVDVSDLGLLPDLTPIDFSADVGSVTPNSNTTISGLATALFTTQVVGPNTISVTVDNQTVSIVLQVEEPQTEPQTTEPVVGQPAVGDDSNFIEGSGVSCSLRKQTSQNTSSRFVWWVMAGLGLAYGLGRQRFIFS